MGGKPSQQHLVHPPLAGQVEGRCVAWHLHSSAELQHNRKVMLGDWPGDGIPAEEVDGVGFGFFSASLLSLNPGGCTAAALVFVVFDGWRVCYKWRGPGH